MNETLLALQMYFDDEGDADGVANVEAPFPTQLVGVTVAVHTESGGATTVTVDIQNGGSDITGFAAIDLDGKSGDAVSVLTPHLGGAVAQPAACAANSLYEVDVNLAAGSTPKLGGMVTLWVLKSEG